MVDEKQSVFSRSCRHFRGVGDAQPCRAGENVYQFRHWPPPCMDISGAAETCKSAQHWTPDEVDDERNGE